MDEYWKSYLKNYTVAEEDAGLEDWELALAIGMPLLAAAVAAIVFAVVYTNKKNKTAAQDRPERMRVDTAVDEDIDVYGNGEETEKSDDTNEE